MNHKIPPLKQLRAFEAAARHQSFKKAAEELNVTQAAVSHQVRALEEILHRQLFHRKTRRVVLTEEAHRFSKRLTAAFAEISDAAAELTDAGLSGKLTLSVLPFFGNRLLLPRLADFTRRYPDILLDPKMEARVVDLHSEEVDGAIRYGTGQWQGLTAIQMYCDQVSPVAAPTYIAGRPLPVDAETIAELTLAGSDQSEWDDWFAAAGHIQQKPLQLIDYPNRARAIDLALAGQGVALADSKAVAADLAAGLLVQINPLTVPSRKNLYVVFPDTTHPNPRLLAFAEWFKIVLKEPDGAVSTSIAE